MAIEGFVGEYDFGKVCRGIPSGSIDVSAVRMGQEYNTNASKNVFWLSNTMVANTGVAASDTDCPMWIALELRMWAGSHGSCPSTMPQWTGVNVNSDEGWMIIFPVAPAATEKIYGHFYVPDAIKGVHTLCLYVWANFSKSDLYDELEVAGYTNPP